MNRAKIFAASLFLLAFASAGAQTPTPIPVTGNLTSILGTGLAYAGVSIQLQNCPSPISIPGYSTIVQTGYQIQANSSGVINSTVWSNDLIDCNGTIGASQYNVAYVANGAVWGVPQCYQVISTQTWNLNTQQPISCSGGAPNPLFLSWLYGAGAPTAACSAIANNGFFYTSTSLNLYQCSNLTGSYGWNLVSANGLSNPVAIGQGGTGATTAAGANLNITGVTQTGTLGTSSQVSTFPGTVAAGTLVPATSPYADLTSPVYGTAKCDGTINVVGGVDENVAAFNLITAIWGTNGYTISSPAASTCVFTEPLNYSATTTSVTGKPISIDLHGGTWEFQVPSTVVARIAVTSGGQGYTVCPTGITLNSVSVASTVTCSLSTYATVSSVTLTNPYSGTAYSTPPTVAFVGGTFTTAATAIALMSGDLNITITTPDPLNPPTPNNADIPALRVVNGTLQDDGDGASVLFNLDGGQGTHNFLSNIDIKNVYLRAAHCQTTAFQTSASFQGVIENSYAFEGDSPTGITSACYGYYGFSIQPGVPGVGTAEWMLKNLVVQGWDHGIYVSPFVGAQVNTDNNIVDETLEEGIYLGHAATSVGDHAEDSWYQNNQLANGTVQSNRGEIYVAAGSIATGSTGALHTSNSDANAVVVTTSSSSTNSFVPSIGGAYSESGNNIISFAYSSGSPTISGTTSQTCTVTFPGIISPAQDEIGTIALTGTNTISTGSATAITRYGLAWTTGVATTGTLTNGTATCSGTATFSVVAYDTARVTGTGSAYVSGIPFNKSGTQTMYAPSATINPIPAGSVSNTALAHSSATVNGVNCALGSTCTISSIGSAAVPPWLQYVGAGSEGAKNCSGNLNGDHHFTTFTVDSGNTCTVNSPAGLTIHATGACTINGTIYAGAINTNATSFTPPVGTAGGGGGGTNAGTAALSNALYPLASSTAGSQVSGGTGGTIGGGAGGAGNQPSSIQNLWKGLLSAGTDDGLYWSGGPGGAGSGGTASGAGGGSVVLICGSIVGSGTINTSGAAGSDASANNAGGGGGGAAGPIVLSSLQFAAPYSITLTQTGGAGGGCAAHTGCGVGGAGVAGLNAEF